MYEQYCHNTLHALWPHNIMCEEKREDVVYIQYLQSLQGFLQTGYFPHNWMNVNMYVCMYFVCTSGQV